ncbi:MAG: signal peptidase I [bacterium]
MLRNLYNWFMVPVEEKSVQREIVEIIIFYIVLAIIVIIQDEIPLQWVLFSLVLLLGMAREGVREFLRVGLLAGIIVFGFVRPFVVQAFYIPSRSMENTLLVNDHIFVNKFIYRVVNPARWDIIVFEYPRDPSKDYIKRLAAKSGDTIAIKDNQVYLNGEAIDRREVSKEVELFFFGSPKAITQEDDLLGLRYRADGINIDETQIGGGGRSIEPLQGRSRISRIIREEDNHNVKEVFNSGAESNSTVRSDFGPVSIPEPGQTINLSELNEDELNCIINYLRQKTDERVYLRNGQVYRKGQPVQELTIEEKLYFVLGDNRDHSEDSRVWGFVPDSRLEGKAFFIYWPITRMGRIIS